ncbi:PH domain-containing protein [Luteimonas wenzhouensis]|jgi:putative membrane protein|uniref:PH domain-containing protein n=1 Tax=Luteimonas wenzhouensis TaxID=2599615 RepID=A0A5C5TXN7_9GAMM|nr:PH domain-containing protein [Luteimonas wenzhouensis]TWT18973.1 PH domain-containing protein [Luteimonas wenzhouensis]
MTTTPEPPAAGVERRLHPWSWLFVLLGSMRQFLVPLAVLVVLGGRREEGLQLAAAGIAVAVLAVASVWRYFTYRYRVDGDSLFIRSGLFERSLRQVPFSRIHNVEVIQGVMHRVFGVAEVKLESAGGTRPEAQMRVLRLEDALALERLIRHRGRADAARVAADGGEDAAQTLLALPTSEIVRLGLVSNRGMVVVGAAMALASQVLPENMFRHVFERMWQQGSGYVSTWQGGIAGPVLAATSLVLLALALLRLFSVALALARYHGFRLQAHGRRLTVERGLFQRVRSSVPRRRIQAWTLREGVLHRLFSRRSLAIDTAGSQVTGDGRGRQHEPPELAPIASPQACDALLQELLDARCWPPSHWHPLHRRAWLRLWLGHLPWAIALVAALAWNVGPWGAAGLLWLAWGGVLARRHARFAGWHLGERLVAVREGWWSRHWRFAEIDKLQALQLRQSWLDRRFGMASLWLDTAGAGAATPPLRIRHIAETDARALYDRLRGEVARRPLRW